MFNWSSLRSSKSLENLFKKSTKNEMKKAGALMFAECETWISFWKSVLRARFQKHFYNKKYLISLERFSSQFLNDFERSDQLHFE